MKRNRYPRIPRTVLNNLNRVETWLFLILIASIVFVSGYLFGENGEGGWNIPSRGGEGRDAAADVSSGNGSREDIAPRGEPVRFLSYNACNYFVDDAPPGTGYKTVIKNEQSREAVASNIRAALPAMVGLCEIGGDEALKDLQGRLEKRGIHLPESFVLHRPAEYRCLAFLSKYPIVANDSRQEVPIDANGKRKMLRGILDVTVQTPDGRLFRFVGVHLKSKKDDDGTAEHTRRLEAYALRQYLADTQSNVPVVVYGEFNDSPNTPVLQAVMGERKSAGGFSRIVPGDSRKETWTLKYGEAQAYFSYDHLLLGRRMQERVGAKPACGIVDSVDYGKASDHRALWVDLR